MDNFNKNKNNNQAEIIEARIEAELIEEQNKIRKWVLVGLIFLIVSVLFSLIVATLVFGGQSGMVSSLKALSIRWGVDEPSNSKETLGLNMVPRLIDGVLVSAGEENSQPLALMIDSHVDARPSSGLANANLVINAPVEGGINRYLAIYAGGDQREEIGPVRSARPYFIDWAREYSSLYVHVGGSPEALVKLKTESILYINEFYNEHNFWRGTRLKPPHNVFTSTDLLFDFLEDKKFSPPKYFSWIYKNDRPVYPPEHQSVKITHSDPAYLVQWQYNARDNDYERYLGNKSQQDVDGANIKAKNIVMQLVIAEEVDEELRLEIEIIGSGNAIICLDGVCQAGSWQKKNARARTRYYYKDDEEVEFNRGITWVEVVREEQEIIY